MKREVSSHVLIALALAASSAAGCNRDAVANQSTERPGAVPNASEAKAPEGQGVTGAKTQFDESAFNLSIAPRAAVDRGQSGEVVVVLTAKAPFHVNHEYPHRLKVIAARGLTTPSTTIQRDPAKVTPARLELVVPVTLGQSGPYGLDGEMSFSVCTDEKCLMEKRQLTVSIGPK